jgi:hypothetical protein
MPRCGTTEDDNGGIPLSNGPPSAGVSVQILGHESTTPSEGFAFTFTALVPSGRSCSADQPLWGWSAAVRVCETKSRRPPKAAVRYTLNVPHDVVWNSRKAS